MVTSCTKWSWCIPSQPAELRAITITGPRGGRTFTSPTVIGAVTALLNGLPALPAPPVTTPFCATQGAGYDVQFAVRRGALPWTQVTVARGCQDVDVDVDVDGVGQPQLADPGGTVVSYLASLMR
jgi:hypothetical protein